MVNTLSIILLLVILLVGVIRFIKKTKFSDLVISAKGNYAHESRLFSCLFLLSGLVMFLILIINMLLNGLSIVSFNGLIIALSGIPEELGLVIIEEFLFRMLSFYGLFYFFKNQKHVLLVSSVVFCLIHHPNNWMTYLSYFLAGLMYGLAYLQFRTLWAPTGLHFGWNYFQGVIFGFPVSNTCAESVLELDISPNILLNGGEVGPEGSILGILARIFIITVIILVSRYKMESFKKLPEFIP